DGTGRLHAPALRGAIDRGDRAHPRLENQRRQTWRLSSREETTHGACSVEDVTMSSHYAEDDLILYYYGEGRRRGDIDRHLESCAACAEAYRDLAATLQLVGPPETPE